MHKFCSPFYLSYAGVMFYNGFLLSKLYHMFPHFWNRPIFSVCFIVSYITYILHLVERQENIQMCICTSVWTMYMSLLFLTIGSSISSEGDPRCPSAHAVFYKCKMPWMIWKRYWLKARWEGFVKLFASQIC